MIVYAHVEINETHVNKYKQKLFYSEITRESAINACIWQRLRSTQEWGSFIVEVKEDISSYD